MICPTCGHERETFTDEEGTSGFVPPQKYSLSGIKDEKMPNSDELLPSGNKDGEELDLLQMVMMTRYADLQATLDIKEEKLKNREQLVFQLEKRNVELESEVIEQCRLNGMGSQREAALLGEVERLKRELADWKSNAHRFGETMSTVGPTGYYEFTPDEWYDWMVSTRKKQWKARP